MNYTLRNFVNVVKSKTSSPMYLRKWNRAKPKHSWNEGVEKSWKATERIHIENGRRNVELVPNYTDLLRMTGEKIKPKLSIEKACSIEKKKREMTLVDAKSKQFKLKELLKREEKRYNSDVSSSSSKQPKINPLLSLNAMVSVYKMTHSKHHSEKHKQFKIKKNPDNWKRKDDDGKELDNVVDDITYLINQLEKHLNPKQKPIVPKYPKKTKKVPRKKGKKLEIMTTIQEEDLSSYNKKTRPQLISICKENNWKGYSKYKKKQDLVDFILEQL